MINKLHQAQCNITHALATIFIFTKDQRMATAIKTKIETLLTDLRAELDEAEAAEKPDRNQQMLRQVRHNLETAAAAADEIHEVATPRAPRPTR